MTDTTEVGAKYGRLTVMGPAPSRHGNRHWQCLCDCGNEVVAAVWHVRNGGTQSCGCLRLERTKENLTKHGGAVRGKQHPLYYTWAGIKQRCGNENSAAFQDYGGRGIAMHESWVSDFGAFRDWILAELGDRPEGQTLDRIDPDGNYAPGNLRWATWTEQRTNQRNCGWQQLQRERDALLDLVLRLLEIS